MTSIYNFVSTALYNRFSQSRYIQRFAAGIGCLSQGKHLLCDPDPSPNSSLLRKIERKALGVLLLAGGLAGLYYGGAPLIGASTNQLKREFLFGQSPLIQATEKDPYEQAFKNRIETLYLGVGAETDYNGALNPSAPDSLPNCLDAISKLKYKTIFHPLQICEEIQSASQSGPVQDLVIGAHGAIHSMHLSPTSAFTVFDELPANCFDGLSSKARIFLHSCSTGEHSLLQPNVAEWLSWISKKEVIAPADIIYSNAGKCSIDSETGRLDIEFRDPIFPGYTADHTEHFNTSSSWTDKALFSVKMVAPTILGAMVTWQTMRFGATVLQKSGIAAEWLVDKTSDPIKRLAEKTGFYNPNAARILYKTTKGTSQILNTTGKIAHQAMDKLIQPVSTLGSWIFRESIRAADPIQMLRTILS